MGQKLFKTSFLGYKKSDVMEYLQNVTEEFGKSDKEKDNQIKDLTVMVISYEKELDMLRKSKIEFDNMKNYISTAIIRAEEHASKIVEDAKNQALSEKNEVQLEATREVEKLSRLKMEAINLRKSLVLTIKRLNSDLISCTEEEKSRQTVVDGEK